MTVAAPESISIGPHTYEVRSDHDTAVLLRAENNNGDSRPSDLLIRVDPDRPHTAVADTVLHEALHCAWSQTSLRASENLTDHEEAIVTALAPLLLGMLRANPDLVKFLTSDG